MKHTCNMFFQEKGLLACGAGALTERATDRELPPPIIFDARTSRVPFCTARTARRRFSLTPAFRAHAPAPGTPPSCASRFVPRIHPATETGGNCPAKISKIPSEASDGFSATDKTLSEASDSLTATDKMLSETSDGFSATDKAPSEASNGFTATDKTLSEASDAFTATDKVPSETSDTLTEGEAEYAAFIDYANTEIAHFRKDVLK